MLLDTLWNEFGKTAYLTSITALVVGVLSQFRAFIAPENEIRSRCSLIKERGAESVNQALDRLLDKVLDLDKGKWRGSPPSSPDLLGDYTKEVFRILCVHEALRRLDALSRKCFSTICWTVWIGIACVLAAFTPEPLRNLASIIATACLVLQFACVATFRRINAHLCRYEHEA